MATLDDVRAIALSLPETHEAVDGHRGGAGWRTKDGLFAWERGPSKADLAKLAGGNLLRVMEGAEAAAARLRATELPAEATIDALDGASKPASR